MKIAEMFFAGLTSCVLPSESLPADQGHRIERSLPAITRGVFFFHLVAFSRSQKKIGLQPILPRVEIKVTPVERKQSFVVAMLHNSPGFDHQDLVRLANRRQ